jgi:hypothetical protein
MIKLLLLLILPLSIFASKILSYNIYERTDRVDVMITFDTPYEGTIKQSVNNSKIVIKLEDASIESSKIKKISSKFIRSLTITPLSRYTQIVASVPSSTKVKASKTADSYGLRLRFSNRGTATLKEHQTTSSSLSSLPTKKEGDMSKSYLLVVGILIVGIIILLIFKKKIALQTPKKKENNSWLFKETKKEPTPESKPVEQANSSTNDVSIRFQKNINSKSNVVMLDFGEQSYLVLMGNNNILLDKFIDNKPETQEDFETILQNRHQELDEFLRVDNTKHTQTSDAKEALQAYKERAASIVYDA